MTGGGEDGNKRPPMVLPDGWFDKVHKAIKIINPSSAIAHQFIVEIKDLKELNRDDSLVSGLFRIDEQAAKLGNQLIKAYNNKQREIQHTRNNMRNKVPRIKDILNTLWNLHDVKHLYDKTKDIHASHIQITTSGGTGPTNPNNRTNQNNRGTAPGTTRFKPPPDRRGIILSMGYPGATQYEESSFYDSNSSDGHFKAIASYVKTLHEASIERTNQDSKIQIAKNELENVKTHCKNFIEIKTKELGIDSSSKPFPDDDHKSTAKKIVTQNTYDMLDVFEYFVKLFGTHHTSSTNTGQSSTEIKTIKRMYTEFKTQTNLQRILTSGQDTEKNLWKVFYDNVINSAFGAEIMRVHKRMSVSSEGKLLLVGTEGESGHELNESFVSQINGMHDAIYGMRVIQDSGTLSTNPSKVSELQSYLEQLKETATEAAVTVTQRPKSIAPETVTTSGDEPTPPPPTTPPIDYHEFEGSSDLYATEYGAPASSSSSGGKPSPFLYRKFDEKAADVYVSTLIDFHNRFNKQSLVRDWQTMVGGPASSSFASLKDASATFGGEGDADTNVDQEMENIMKNVLQNTRRVCDSYFGTLARFFTSTFRKGFFYMNYWQHKVDNEETRAFKSIIKNIDQIVEKNVKGVREVIRRATSTSDDGSSDEGGLSKWAQLAESVETVKKGSLYLDRTAEVLTTLRNDVKNLLLGKGLPLRVVLLRSPLLLMYLTKGTRVFFAWAALHFAERIFHMWYVRRVYGQGKTPPNPLGFVGLFLSFEAVMTTLLFVVFLGIRLMAGDGPGYFPVNGAFLKAFVVDYVFSTLCVFSVSAVIAAVVQKKKYFRYKYEGERGIRALSTMTFYVALVLLLVPYFRLVG